MKNKIFILSSIAFIMLNNNFTTYSSYNTEYPEVSYHIETDSKESCTRWVYKTINGRQYKRLYNYSTGEWIGNWIPV